MIAQQFATTVSLPISDKPVYPAGFLNLEIFTLLELRNGKKMARDFCGYFTTHISFLLPGSVLILLLARLYSG